MHPEESTKRILDTRIEFGVDCMKISKAQN